MPTFSVTCGNTIYRHHPHYRGPSTSTASCIHGVDIPNAHRADVFRAHRLATNGGCWIDSDIILLKPATELIEQANADRTFVAFGHRAHRPKIPMLAAWPGCPIAAEWARRQRVRLWSNPDTPLKWTEIGESMLAKIIADRPDWPHVVYPMKRIAPIPWQKAKRWLEPGDIDDFTDDHTIGCHLSGNSLANTRLPTIGRDELLESDMLISSAFRKALGLK